MFISDLCSYFCSAFQSYDKCLGGEAERVCGVEDAQPNRDLLDSVYAAFDCADNFPMCSFLSGKPSNGTSNFNLPDDRRNMVQKIISLIRNLAWFFMHEYRLSAFLFAWFHCLLFALLNQPESVRFAGNFEPPTVKDCHFSHFLSTDWLPLFIGCFCHLFRRKGRWNFKPLILTLPWVLWTKENIPKIGTKELSLQSQHQLKCSLECRTSLWSGKTIIWLFKNHFWNFQILITLRLSI